MIFLKPAPFLYSLCLLLSITFSVLADSAQTSHEQNSKHQQLVASAEQSLDVFLTEEHWAAVRNLSGVAKAVFIVPRGGQAGLLLGGQWGTGVLLVRHHHDWSDPLFVNIRSVQFGLLAGGQRFSGIGAILSQAALDSFLAGSFSLGGSADLTLGPGISGKATGSSGGIEVLMVSSNTGAYLGGSIEGVHLGLDKKLNHAAYGTDFSADKVLKNKQGGAYPSAKGIQTKLREAAYHAVFGED